MSSREKEVAQQITSMILKEYGETDNRLGEQFAAIAKDNEDVARECLLMMATLHIKGAVAIMKAAGLTGQQITEELLGHAYKHDLH